MVELSVSRLGLDSATNSYVVILREKAGTRVLPIWIGKPEAESILMQMNQLKRERPLTHDLCKSLITALGGALRRVTIARVEKHCHCPAAGVSHLCPRGTAYRDGPGRRRRQ